MTQSSRFPLLLSLISLGAIGCDTGYDLRSQTPVLIETSRSPLARTDICAELVLSNQAVVWVGDEIAYPSGNVEVDRRATEEPLLRAFGPVRVAYSPFGVEPVLEHTDELIVPGGLGFGETHVVEIPFAPETALRPYLNAGFQLASPQKVSLTMSDDGTPLAPIQTLECGTRVELTLLDESDLGD